jgi:hypothetical protein
MIDERTVQTSPAGAMRFRERRDDYLVSGGVSSQWLRSGEEIFQGMAP